MATQTEDESRPAELDANRLLRALSEEIREDLRSALELVEHDIRDEMFAQGEAIEFVYFPVDGVGSLLAAFDVGRPVEVATVGHEGMIGLPVFLNASSTSAYMAFVQVAGRFWRMPAAELRRQLGNGTELHDVLQRYTQALFGQLAISVACNRAHTAQERLPRWLLMTHDRARRDEFAITQEFLAQMLGVRRGTVNEIAGDLQAKGLISYSRGRLTITNREGLENASCECYHRVNEEFDRVLPE